MCQKEDVTYHVELDFFVVTRVQCHAIRKTWIIKNTDVSSHVEKSYQVVQEVIDAGSSVLKNVTRDAYGWLKKNCLVVIQLFCHVTRI